MSKLFTFSVMFVLLFSSLLNSQWLAQSSGTTKTLYSSSFWERTILIGSFQKAGAVPIGRFHGHWQIRERRQKTHWGRQQPHGNQVGV